VLQAFIRNPEKARGSRKAQVWPLKMFPGIQARLPSLEGSGDQQDRLIVFCQSRPRAWRL